MNMLIRLMDELMRGDIFDEADATQSQAARNFHRDHDNFLWIQEKLAA